MTADDTVAAKLAEWEALANAATDGPWEWIDGPRRELANHTRGVLRCAALAHPHPADAEFIAAARHMAPALLAAVQGVLRVCDERRGGCGDDYTDGWTAGWADALLEVRRAITQQIGGEA